MDVAAATVTKRNEEPRMRLRHDLIFAEVPTGTLVRHSDGGFVLRGKSIYRWITTLAPFLDGTKTREDLVGGLDDGRAAMVNRLLDALVDRGALSGVTGPTVDDGHELADYRQQIAYIEHYAEDGVERFAAFRDANVTVVGDDAVADAIRNGLLSNGLKRVHGPGELPGGGDVVVVTATQGGAHRVVEALRTTSRTVLPVVRVGRRVVVGPMTGPDKSGDWVTAMARLTRNDDNGDAALLWQDSAAPGTVPAPSALRPQQASLIGMMAAYEVFRDFTMAPKAETDGAVVVVDLETGDATREEVLVNPHDTGERTTVPPEGFAAELDAAPAPVETADEEHDHEQDYEDLRRVMRMAGEHVGIITGYDDEEIDQAPIKIARCTFHSGSPTADAALGFAVETPGDARRGATRNAILEYVTALGPLTPADTKPSRRIAADLLVTATGLGLDGEHTEWTTGRVLDDDVVDVPTAAVYARSAVNATGAFERTSAGEGAGDDLDTAIRAGLRSALAFEGVLALARGEKVHQVSLSNMDDTVRYLVRSAELVGLEMAVYRLPAAEPAMAMFAVIPGTTDYAVGVGTDVSAATADALTTLIGRTLTTGLPGHDELLIPGLDPRVARVATDNGAFTSTEAPLVSALRSQDREAVVVETTPADVLASGALRTVRVLLTRPGSAHR